ncbi:hypothetical protein ACFX2F_033609 [Malus domestica]
MQTPWLASPQQWKTRLEKKFMLDCWQHQALWPWKYAPYNGGIYKFLAHGTLPNKSKLSKFDTSLPTT